MTKRKLRKEENKEAGEENGVDAESDDKNSRSETNETKKRKSERRSSSKKSKKAEPISDEVEKPEEEEEDDTQYEVQEIMDEKMIKGVRHYLIRWKGYDEDGDTWEPESTLNCANLIKKFKEKSNEENESPKKGKKGKDRAKVKSTKKRKSTNDKAVENGKKMKKEVKSQKKSKPKNLTGVDWESDDEFEVDRILDVKFKKNGKREFLVSWKGYPSTQDSWEPEENLDCTNLIERFMDGVGQAKSVEQKKSNTSKSDVRLSRRSRKK